MEPLRPGGVVARDFVQARLDAVFALLSDAEMEGMADGCQNAWHAIEEAERAIDDGERRLIGLEDGDRTRLMEQFERLRVVVQGIRLRLE